MNKIRRKRQRAALMLITAAGIMLSLAGIAAARYMKQESQSGVVEAPVSYTHLDVYKRQTMNSVCRPCWTRERTCCALTAPKASLSGRRLPLTISGRILGIR